MTSSCASLGRGASTARESVGSASAEGARRLRIPSTGLPTSRRGGVREERASAFTLAFCLGSSHSGSIDASPAASAIDLSALLTSIVALNVARLVHTPPVFGHIVGSTVSAPHPPCGGGYSCRYATSFGHSLVPVIFPAVYTFSSSPAVWRVFMVAPQGHHSPGACRAACRCLAVVGSASFAGLSGPNIDEKNTAYYPHRRAL